MDQSTSQGFYLHHLPYFRLLSDVFPGLRLLQVGGGGYTAQYAAKLGARVTCALPNEAALRSTRALYPTPGLELTIARGATLPFADGQFDVVMLFESLGQGADPEALITELRRILTPDGFAVITLPNVDRDDLKEVMGEGPSGAVGQSPAELYGPLTERFHYVSLLTQTPFMGYLMAQYAEGPRSPSFDTLVGEREAPLFHSFLVSDLEIVLEEDRLIQVPFSHLVDRLQGGLRSFHRALERKNSALLELREELSHLHSRNDALLRRADASEAHLAHLKGAVEKTLSAGDAPPLAQLADALIPPTGDARGSRPQRREADETDGYEGDDEDGTTGGLAGVSEGELRLLMEGLHGDDIDLALEALEAPRSAPEPMALPGGGLLGGDNDDELLFQEDLSPFLLPGPVPLATELRREAALLRERLQTRIFALTELEARRDALEDLLGSISRSVESHLGELRRWDPRDPMTQQWEEFRDLVGVIRTTAAGDALAGLDAAPQEGGGEEGVGESFASALRLRRQLAALEDARQDALAEVETIRGEQAQTRAILGALEAELGERAEAQRELSRERESLRKRLSSAEEEIDGLQVALGRLESRHSDLKAQLSAALGEAEGLRSGRAEAEEALRALESEVEGAREAAQAEHADAMEALETAHAEALEAMEAEKAQALEAMEARLEGAERAHGEATLALEAEQVEAIEALRAEHNEATLALEAEHGEAIGALDAEQVEAIEALRAEQAEAIEALKAEHAEGLAAQSDGGADAQARLLAQVKAAEEARAQLEAERGEIDGALADAEAARGDAEAALAELQAQLQAQRAEALAARGDAEAARAELAALKAEMERRQRLDAETAQAGMSTAEAAEEDPRIPILEAEVETLRSALAEAEALAAAPEGEGGDRAALALAQTESDETRAALREAEGQISALEEERAALLARLDAAEVEIAEAREASAEAAGADEAAGDEAAANEAEDPMTTAAPATLGEAAIPGPEPTPRRGASGWDAPSLTDPSAKSRLLSSLKEMAARIDAGLGEGDWEEEAFGPEATQRLPGFADMAPEASADEPSALALTIQQGIERLFALVDLRSRSLMEARERGESLESAAEELSRALAEVEPELTALRAQVGELLDKGEGLEERIRTLKAQRVDFEEEIRRLQAQLEESDEDRRSLQDDLTQALEDREGAQAIKEAARQIAGLEDTIESLREGAEELEQTQTRQLELEDALHQLTAQRKALELRLAQRDEELGELKAEVQRAWSQALGQDGNVAVSASNPTGAEDAAPIDDVESLEEDPLQVLEEQIAHLEQALQTKEAQVERLLQELDIKAVHNRTLQELVGRHQSELRRVRHRLQDAIARVAEIEPGRAKLRGLSLEDLRQRLDELPE